MDRFLLVTERQSVQLAGARGAISHAQSRKVLAELQSRVPDSQLLQRHMAVEEALTETPLSIGNLAQPLEDGPATYAAMLAAIREARHHVHLEMYIVEDDAVGRDFAQALTERARSGVQVRLIYDSVGSIRTPKAFFKDLEAAGVEVAEFNPVSPGNVLKDLVAIQNRDHRKLLVVDGRVAFLGGINISVVHGSSSGPRVRSRDRPFEERPWRDMQVRLEGPVVADLQRAFVAQWEKVKQARLDDPRLFPKLGPRGPHVVRAIASAPAQSGAADALYLALISAIESAENEVLITNAYFVPHPQLLAALEAAARRGVDVKLVLPGRSDSQVVYHAGRAYYDELLQAGVKIHERKTRLLHAKSAVVDGVWSAVGSTNLDWRSLAYNDELNAVVLGADFAERMKAIFGRDLAHSEEITLAAWRDRPWSDRIKEFGAKTIAELL